jgi:peroxiredoxin
MRQPPATFGRIMSKIPPPAFRALPFRTLWMQARRGGLNPGDPAPDFTLPAQDGKSRVTLSSFRGKRPVVLVFGSYT